MLVPLLIRKYRYRRPTTGAATVTISVDLRKVRLVGGVTFGLAHTMQCQGQGDGGLLARFK